MQGKGETWSDFLRRTDTLAVVLGIDVGDLPSRLGISRASLFRYRSGKSPISRKAWIKLAFAETDAGIQTPLAKQLQEDGSDDELATLRKIFERGDWTEDLDAQFAALVGQGVIGKSVLASWSVLGDFLGAFFDKLQKFPETSEALAGYIAEEVPSLRKQIEGFDFELARFVERVSETDASK